MKSKPAEKDAQKAKAKILLNCLQKYKDFEFPKYRNLGLRDIKFVRNSATENLRYGELFNAKAEILMQLDKYLSKDLVFEKVQISHNEKANCIAFYKAESLYRGQFENLRGRKIELMLKEYENGTIVFYFIKFVWK